MTPKPLCEFLVASCVPDGGAYRYQLSRDLSLTVTQFLPMPCPMYLSVHGNAVWAVLREPFPNSTESGLGCYALDDGSLRSPICTTKGEIACHLAVIDHDIYCANYQSGSLIHIPGKLQCHFGSSLHPVRQTASHVHGIFPSPDGQFLLVCDLGLDCVFVYTRDLTPVSQASVPAGFGPRHLCFSKDGQHVYCLCELSSSICVFSFREGILNYLYQLPLLPADFPAEGSAAAICLSDNGTRLYITERTAGQIITLAIEGTVLSILDRTPCGGKEPRDFALLASDRYGVCTNQHSDLISLFRIDDNGIPSFLYSSPVPAPLCVIPLSE